MVIIQTGHFPRGLLLSKLPVGDLEQLGALLETLAKTKEKGRHTWLPPSLVRRVKVMISVSKNILLPIQVFYSTVEV